MHPSFSLEDLQVIAVRLPGDVYAVEIKEFRGPDALSQLRAEGLVWDALVICLEPLSPGAITRWALGGAPLSGLPKGCKIAYPKDSGPPAAWRADLDRLI